MTWIGVALERKFTFCEFGLETDKKKHWYVSTENSRRGRTDIGGCVSIGDIGASGWHFVLKHVRDWEEAEKKS